MKSTKRPSKSSQLCFQGVQPFSSSFGGSLLKSHPKAKRPLDSKLPIHLTLRARRSCLRLPKTLSLVNCQVQETARRYGVRIYAMANVGNHLHLLIKITSRRSWSAFIRELTGRIAQVVAAILPALSTKHPSTQESEASHRSTKASHGSTNREKSSFWLYRPHTRVVQGWRKAFQAAKEYVQLNILEADGFISRAEIRTLKDLRAIWSG